MLIDTHAHLDDPRFADDLDAVLARAAAAGVERIVTIGTDLATSRAAVALTERHPVLAAAVGIHPNHAGEAGPDDLDHLAALLTHPGVVAVGEIGLDRHWDAVPPDVQERWFLAQLAMARRAGKPIIIHCREAEADVVRLLRDDFAESGPMAGVLHSYTGSLEDARAGWELGLHVSFAGMATYKPNEALRAVAAAVPDDRLLVETDCPYLAPVPVRGKRNEPAYVAHTAAVLARVRGVPVERLAARTTANARTLFGL